MVLKVITFYESREHLLNTLRAYCGDLSGDFDLERLVDEHADSIPGYEAAQLVRDGAARLAGRTGMPSSHNVYYTLEGYWDSLLPQYQH